MLVLLNILILYFKIILTLKYAIFITSILEKLKTKKKLFKKIYKILTSTTTSKRKLK